MMFDWLPQDLPVTLDVMIVLIAGVVLLRISGKRSISQMTVPEAVLLIALGTLLINGTAPLTIWAAVYGGLLLVLGMLLLSYLQVIFPPVRKWLLGVPSVLVKDGRVELQEMKKTKMNMDQLEMRLRHCGIENMSDVKTAVLEPSGLLTVVKKEEKKNADKSDIQKILNEIELLKLQWIKESPAEEATHLTTPVPDVTKPTTSSLFSEARKEDKKGENISTH